MDISQAYDVMLAHLKQNHPNNEEMRKESINNFKNGVLNFLENQEVLVSGKKVRIRKACILDSEFIQSTELLPDNSPWVANWLLNWRI